MHLFYSLGGKIQNDVCNTIHFLETNTLKYIIHSILFSFKRHFFSDYNSVITIENLEHAQKCREGNKCHLKF